MKNLTIEQSSKILKTLGNEIRLKVLYKLLESEKSVGELEKSVEISQSSLSQHLAILRREGVVQTRRDAQTIYYSCKNERVIKILRLLTEIF